MLITFSSCQFCQERTIQSKERFQKAEGWLYNMPSQCTSRQNEAAREHSHVEVGWMAKCTQEVTDVTGFSRLSGAEEREHAVQEQANLLI